MKKKVLAIMLVAMSIMLISACGKKEKLYEIPDLSQYKTDYVGDSSNVINIVSGQEYPPCRPCPGQGAGVFTAAMRQQSQSGGRPCQHLRRVPGGDCRTPAGL